MFSNQDVYFMQKAILLAQQAEGRTSPNPLVGCVIARENKIVGEGFHQKAGTPHAEIHALRAAGNLAKDATVFVTLEPCSHYGRTPPCAEALINAGVKRVVVAMVDPNPLVSGQGINRLQEAGIQVDIGLLAKESQALNEPFIKVITQKFPFVTYKAALTLDGKTATIEGNSKWISNEKSREYSHKLRNRYDVIMVGSETIIKDDPYLTCRIAGGRDPVRLIIDGRLQIPTDAKVLTSSASSPCIIATTEAIPQAKVKVFESMKNVEVIQFPSERFVPLNLLFHEMLAKGYNSILLEGGSKLAGAMIQEGLIDKIEFFLAPKILGSGISPFHNPNFQEMSQALKLYDWNVSLETGDIHVTGYLNPSSS